MLMHRSFQLLNDGHPQEIIQPSSQENTAQHKIQIESTYPFYFFILPYSDSKKEKEQQEELVSTTKQDNKNPSTQVVSLISNSKEEKVYCFFCHGKDDIVKCYGGCNRYFHLRCIGMKGKKDMKKWKCRACSGSDLRSSTFHKKHCLRNWYIRNAVELADGSISILIEGTLCSDESTWKCSPIDHLLDSSHFVTINHSIYTLIVILLFILVIFRVKWIMKKQFNMVYLKKPILFVEMDYLLIGEMYYHHIYLQFMM